MHQSYISVHPRERYLKFSKMISTDFIWRGLRNCVKQVLKTHSWFLGTKMSLADSEAAFEQHCNKLVADGSLAAQLVNNGIKSLSALAFASGTPQSPPTEEQFKDFATQINGGVDMSFGMQVHLKRLHFEASAIVMAELKSRATDTSTDGARKLPLAEKAARLKDQEARLPGLRLKGELQPSYALVDLVAQIKETNCITWIPPSKCSKRDSEVQNNLQREAHDALTWTADGEACNTGWASCCWHLDRFAITMGASATGLSVWSMRSHQVRGAWDLGAAVAGAANQRTAAGVRQSVDQPGLQSK